MNNNILRVEVDEIEKQILLHSISHHLSMHELKIMYKRVLSIKGEFMQVQFSKTKIEDIDTLRIDILESIYHIKIYIREKLGLSVIDDLESLKMM